MLDDTLTTGAEPPISRSCTPPPFPRRTMSDCLICAGSDDGRRPACSRPLPVRYHACVRAALYAAKAAPARRSGLTFWAGAATRIADYMRVRPRIDSAGQASFWATSNAVAASGRLLELLHP
jgi:hypothetical protein